MRPLSRNKKIALAGLGVGAGVLFSLLAYSRRRPRLVFNRPLRQPSKGVALLEDESGSEDEGRITSVAESSRSSEPQQVGEVSNDDSSSGSAEMNRPEEEKAGVGNEGQLSEIRLRKLSSQEFVRLIKQLPIRGLDALLRVPYITQNPALFQKIQTELKLRRRNPR